MTRTAPETTEPHRLGPLPILGIAAAGLLLGHLVSYAVALPDPHHRDLVLHRTGHGYLPAAGQAAIVLLLAGLASVVLRSVWRRPLARSAAVAPIVLRLALVQTVAFGLLEVAERLVAGAGLQDLRDGRILLAGWAIQVAVAFVGAAALRALVRASGALAGRGRAIALPRPALAFAAPARADAIPRRTAATAYGERAPPSA